MTTADSAETRRVDVGIPYATAFELKPFLDLCQRKGRREGPSGLLWQGALLNQQRLVLLQMGMGPQRADFGCRQLIADHQPRWVVSAGFSGALQPGLQLGDIVVATATSDPNGGVLEIDLQMPADPAQGLHVGRLLTIDHVARSIAEKTALGADTGALAVDMETHALAQVCRELRVPFLAVRVISDDLTSELPPEAEGLLGGTGVVRLGAAAAALWKRPAALGELWQLREAGNLAAGRLAPFLAGMLSQLAGGPEA